MIGLETDHVISGPMGGLKINFIGRGQHSTYHSWTVTIIKYPKGSIQLRIKLTNEDTQYGWQDFKTLDVRLNVHIHLRNKNPKKLSKPSKTKWVAPHPVV